jgi:hypothetical protein
MRWRANGPPDHPDEGLAQQVIGLANQIKPLLAGRPPEVQGAVLAELLATWVAGHVDPTNRERTADMRTALLAQHLTFVEQLVTVGATEMGLPW